MRRARTLLAALCLVLACTGAHAGDAEIGEGAEACPDVSESVFLQVDGQDEVLLADGCCKRCSKGKPCGDSCIAKDKACHKPPGCAC